MPEFGRKPLLHECHQSEVRHRLLDALLHLQSEVTYCYRVITTSLTHCRLMSGFHLHARCRPRLKCVRSARDHGCAPGQSSAAGGCRFPAHSQTFPPQSFDISCLHYIAHSFILTHDSNKRLNTGSIPDKGLQHQLHKAVICKYSVSVSQSHVIL